jgi:hypothetical protein
MSLFLKDFGKVISKSGMLSLCCPSSDILKNTTNHNLDAVPLSGKTPKSTLSL